MYYLVVRNLEVVRCIHSDENDVYRDGMSFSCTPDLEFPGGELVKEVSINCSENPGVPLMAKVYRN
ncbi:MAG: hypothetical protein KAT15_03055 [Bacteroidales bacterium]|nr:hypothetical protein [Bacteroidales bacterium]